MFTCGRLFESSTWLCLAEDGRLWLEANRAHRWRPVLRESAKVVRGRPGERIAEVATKLEIRMPDDAALSNGAGRQNAQVQRGA